MQVNNVAVYYADARYTVLLQSWKKGQIGSGCMMPNRTHSILIVDDDEHVLKSLVRLLRSEDYRISCYNDPEEALNRCRTDSFDLVLSDQRMPRMTGTEFLLKLSELHPETRRILISGYSDFSCVTDAFNAGVIHKFVVKPWNNIQLRELVSEQLKLKDQKLSLSLRASKAAADQESISGEADGNFNGILTTDPAMQQQLALIRKTASSEASFFIHGETGTGKELIARAIHDASNRREKPFVAINCANLSETLLESQLFGHKKGAFTGADKDQRGLLAEAESGTLFLDEVTEIPVGLQAKLLRVLQEREYTPLGETKARAFDVKVISASSTKLKDAVKSGKFREDLRYRLEVIPINLPALRARGGDRKVLFDYFLAKQLARNGYDVLPVDPSVYNCIEQYNWPGNVRELINVCTYIAALTNEEDHIITLKNFPPDISNANQLIASQEAAEQSTGLLSRQVTREMLEQAIRDYSGHRDSIAKNLGISRMTLWRKMKAFGLE